jgi:hypothetical protein
MSSRGRVFMLVGIGLIFAVVGTLLFGKRESGDNVTDLELRAQMVGVNRSLCEFERLIASDELGSAKNFYWDKLHISTHVLAVAVGRNDKRLEARFLEVHFKVENGLAMLAPSLKADVPAYATLARSSLKKLNVVGADRPC